MGQHVRVEYADQNEAFASCLPRSGELVRRCTDIDGNEDWWLLKLDEPFDYQLKVGEPFQHRLAHVCGFLVRSRWVGHAVGADAPTAVFILLVEHAQMTVPEPFDPASHVHIAWGRCVADG